MIDPRIVLCSKHSPPLLSQEFGLNRGWVWLIKTSVRILGIMYDDFEGVDPHASVFALFDCSVPMKCHLMSLGS